MEALNYYKKNTMSVEIIVLYCLVVDLTITLQQMEALNYYKKNTMSVEIIVLYCIVLSCS